MGNYVVELSDADGLSCRVRVSLPFYTHAEIGNSTWKVLDEGFLKFRSGGCLMTKSAEGWFQNGNLHLCIGRAQGVKLYSFTDGLTLVNDSGEGVVFQSFVVNCKPGPIGWALVG